MLDFRILTFLAVWEHKSYTKAADLLCITQPAVSQHIRVLETRFGTPLFRWAGRELLLTEPGALLYRWASAAQAEGLKTQALILAKGNAIPFRIGATRTIGEYVLGPLLGRYLEDHPGAELSVVVDNTEALLGKLQGGSLDFAFVEGVVDRGTFATTLFLQDAFRAVGPAHDPLAGQPLRLEQLFERRLLVREPGSGSRVVLERALGSRQASLKDFRQVMELGNVELIKDLVAQGQGISFLYERSILGELASGRLACLEVEDFSPRHDYSFVRLGNSLYEPQYRNFLAQLQESLPPQAHPPGG